MSPARPPAARARTDARAPRRRTPRRFGKTFSCAADSNRAAVARPLLRSLLRIAIFTAAMALSTGCEVVIFSPARRASRKLLERVVEFLKVLDCEDKIIEFNQEACRLNTYDGKKSLIRSFPVRRRCSRSAVPRFRCFSHSRPCVWQSKVGASALDLNTGSGRVVREPSVCARNLANQRRGYDVSRRKRQDAAGGVPCGVDPRRAAALARPAGEFEVSERDGEFSLRTVRCLPSLAPLELPRAPAREAARR